MAKAKPANIDRVAESDVRMLSVDLLDFDKRNPRLSDVDVGDVSSEEEMVRLLWRDMAVDEIVMSIVAAKQFFRHEPLFVIEQTAGRYTVIEGNRRLAAVKLLLNDALRKKVGATSLPRITKLFRQHLETLPVILTTRRASWQYIGFKHVNGPQTWGSHSKAHYIARLHNEEGISLDEIANSIGDRHATVKRLYRGFMILHQAADSGVYDLQDRWNKRLAFSHLYTALGYRGFQEFLGLKEAASYKKCPVSKNRIKQLGEVCLWLYGSKSKSFRPLIRSQNPDLRLVDEALQNPRSIDALRAGLALEVAIDVARGDETVFRESLVEGKLSLGKAYGACVTGDDRKSDTYQLAEDIYSIAGKLLDTMDDHRTKNKRGRGNSRR